MKGKYDDMIHLPHHVSSVHPRMSMLDRAAQFSPFAALTGYESAIQETARVTDRRMELDEDAKADLDQKLRLLEVSPEQPPVALTYFQPDGKKAGGAYITITGRIKKMDEYARVIVLTDGRSINIDDLLELESEAFQALFDPIEEELP